MRDNINQIGIVQLGCWLVGEFGELLVNGQAVDESNQPLKLTPEEIIDTYVDILDENDRKGKRSDVIISWALTALSKLTIRLPRVQSKIKALIEGYQDHANVEI
jgi:AP-1 complex subunit gamma-1